MEIRAADKERAVGVSPEPRSFWISFNMRRGKGGDRLGLIDDKEGQIGLLIREAFV